MLGELATTTNTAQTIRGFRTIFQQQIENMMKAVKEGVVYEPFSAGA